MNAAEQRETNTDLRAELRAVLVKRDEALSAATAAREALKRAVRYLGRNTADVDRLRENARNRAALDGRVVAGQLRADRGVVEPLPTPKQLIEELACAEEELAAAKHAHALLAEEDRIAEEALKRAEDTARKRALAVLDEHTRAHVAVLLELEREQLRVMRSLWARGQLMLPGVMGPVPLPWDVRSVTLRFQNLLERPDSSPPAERAETAERDRAAWRGYLDRLMADAAAEFE